MGRIAFAAAAISVLVAQAVPEAADDAPALDIEIRDYALVPRADMDRAVAEVNRVFDHAGIRAKARVDRRSFCDRPRRRIAPSGSGSEGVRLRANRR